MTFVPGNVANPNGRPKGSRNKLGRELDEAIEESKRLGHPHPYLQMSMIANDPSQPVERRDMFIKECAAYRCPKPKQSVTIETQLPEDISTSDIPKIITDLAHELEPAELVTMLLSLQKSIRDDKELQLKIDHVGDPDKPMTIRIEGGLPTPPDYEGVIMPHQVNGHQGPTIEHQENPSRPEIQQDKAQTEPPTGG
jgi:hypothetical protein